MFVFFPQSYHMASEDLKQKWLYGLLLLCFLSFVELDRSWSSFIFNFICVCIYVCIYMFFFIIISLQSLKKTFIIFKFSMNKRHLFKVYMK